MIERIISARVGSPSVGAFLASSALDNCNESDASVEATRLTSASKPLDCSVEMKRCFGQDSSTFPPLAEVKNATSLRET